MTGHGPRPASLPVVLAALVLALIAVLFFFPPGQYGFYPRCLLHSMTGLHCPGCGSLRAIHELTHGHFPEALRLNALLVAALPALTVALILRARRTGLRGLFEFELPQSKWVWWGLGVLAVFGVLRNLPFAPFHLLAP